MRLIILGSGTDVGKTRLTGALARAMRRRRKLVWLHKPVACGDWDGTGSGDGRALRHLAGDGQDPATVCPRDYPEPCAPHLAARLAGVKLRLEALATTARALAANAPNLLVETAGGVCTPQAEDGTAAQLAAMLGYPAVLVVRPDLGAIHSALSAVLACRSCGVDCRGFVLNHVRADDGSLAVRTAAEEIARWTGLPILGLIAHGDAGDAAADAVLDSFEPTAAAPLNPA